MGIGVIERGLHWRDRFRTRLFTWLIAGQFREIGSGSRISPPFRYWGLHQMALGTGVIISRDCWLQTIPGYGEGDSSQLIIQSHAGIGMGAHISAAKQVVLGESVLLARNVYISDHAHAFEDPNRPIMDQGINRIAPVVIGAGSWLGQNVVILPGVNVGRHCVIGANSVVKSPIPDYSVAVGAPARVIKQFNGRTGRWEAVGGELAPAEAGKAG